MTEKAAKAERSLANTCQKLGITDAGKRWLDICLDPFKDLNMPTAGYPDAVTIPSVVQTIHDSYSLSVPVGVAAGGRWDANIFIDSLYNSVELVSTAYDTAQSFVSKVGQGANAYKRGGLVIRSAPSGTNLDITTTTFGASLKQDVLDEGDVRVIGLGLEIHNTTEELHKAGALITYRVPDAPLTQTLVTLLENANLVACTPLSCMAVPLVELPYTASAAIDLPGSLQWEAKDGAYIVPILSSPTLYPEVTETIPPLTTDGAANYFPKLSSGGAANLVYFTQDIRNLTHGFSTSGAYLTGLSYETSLQVNLTYYVEVFPRKDSVLRRSVQPATGLDARALDLYAHIVSHLPTGVEVNDNFLGAFISGIARIASGVSRYAPTIMRGISLAGELAGVVSGTSNTSPAQSSMRQLARTARITNEEIEEVDSPMVRRDNARSSLSPSNGPIISDVLRSGKELVTQVNNRQITRTEITPRRSNVRVNNGVVVSRDRKSVV